MTAEVLLIFKSGWKEKPQNYHPILLLPVIRKFFEKLTNILLVQHDTLSERYYGSRKKRSTVDAIAKPTLNEICSVFLDLAKAIDTVDHIFHPTFIKMRKVWIETLHHLLKSYLSDCIIFVQIGEKKSAVLDVKYDAPQVSVLEPILFLLYINDIERICQSGEIIFFTDDTTIYFSTERNNDDLLSHLRRLCDSLDRNKLTTKCNMSCFTKREIANRLQLQGITLYCKESTKFLGVHINKN